MANKLVYWLISLVSFYYLILTIGSFYPSYANKLVKNNLSYGDLFQMSKVKDFKIPLPQVFPLSSSSTLTEADIITMGDSFFNIAVGFTDFSGQLANSLNLKVHNYNIQGSGEPWRKTNPLDYLKENNYQKGKAKVLILESVDRGIDMRYSQINRNPTITPTPPLPTITPPKITIKNDLQSPIGSIDLVNYNGRQLHLEGWAADFETGSPLADVSITLDEKIIGQANLNLPRPDVIPYFKQPSWGNSGWSFDIPLRLNFRQHQISAIFTDHAGNQGKPNDPKTLGAFSSFNLLGDIISSIQKINTAIKQQLKKINYLIEENYLNSSINELISTLKFRFFKKISPLTPKYSLNPKLLFYRDEVDFYQNQPSQDNIIKIADNLAFISDQLKTRHHLDFIFIPMPTKYTIYHSLANEPTKNTFFTNLFSELTKRQVNYVDLYHPFINSQELLYLPSDTHWNQKGTELGLKEILKKITIFFQIL